MPAIANQYNEQNVAVSEGWSEAIIYQPHEVEQILLAEQSSCLAVIAYLKMCKLPFEVKCVRNAEFMSPGGRFTKLPILRVGAFVVSEFESIINLVENKNISLTNDLTAEQKSDIRAYMSLVENVFTSAELYMTWVDQDIYNEITFKRYGSVYPFPLNYIQCYRKRRQVYNLLNLYNYNAIPKDEIFEKIRRCCEMLSDLLGTKKYFYGDKPTELDAIVFGHLFSIITTKLSADCPLNAIIKKYENLPTFCMHISTEYFREQLKKKN